jgi:Vitamin K-dependent gamma-carboxylase
MNALTPYVAFWDRREPAHALAAVRIGLGLVMLYDLLQIARLGLIVPLWAPLEQGGIGGHMRVLFYQWFGASATSAYALFGLAFASALLLTLGCFSRLSALTLFFCSAQLSAVAPDADRGIDTLLRNALAVLALSGAGGAWSLDARGRPPSEVPAWPRYLLIAQLVLLYFWAGMLKQSAAWSALGDYSALFSVLSKPHYARFGLSHAQLVAIYPLLQAATIGTLLFERSAILVPLWLWLRGRPGRWGELVRRARIFELWLATGVFFHLTLALFTQLGIFPWGCLALYPALLRPQLVRSGVERIAQRLRALDRSSRVAT